MKTLYININNEQLQSNDELEVLKHDLDSDFFFYLGEKIAKGCNVENENALITDFNSQGNEDDYKQIIAQWNEIKTILFSEECNGNFEFTLPNGYIHWLRFHPQYVSVYDRNFSHGEPTVITIDLEELYEDSIEDLQRKILRKLQRDDLYKEIDEIVFNDDTVTCESPIVCAIKGIYKGIGLKAYKEWIEDNRENLSGNGDPVPQICLKCGKNPCECNTDEHFCYAMEITTGGSWSSESKYKFFNHKGQLLNDNEYYIVDQGRDNNYGLRCKTNLLVIKTENDPTLYFISADGTFHTIGEYYYKHSTYSGVKDKQCHKYNAWIIQSNYILYRNNRDFKLFKIKPDNTIAEKASFYSKEIIYPEHVIKNYIACGEFTIDYQTGEIIKINGCKRGNLIGFYNNEPYYLVAENWQEEETLINYSIVDSKGKVIKRKFGYDDFEYLSENLLIVRLKNGGWSSRRYGIVNIVGDILLPCVYKKIEKVSDDIYKLETKDYDESYYIVSKNKIVHWYNDNYYLIFRNEELCEIYSLKTEELINKVYFNNTNELIFEDYDNHIISNFYFAEGSGNGELRSIIDNSTIYEFPFGNEELVGVNKSVFVIKGDSYIESYDHKGNMLKCIDIDGDYMSNFVLHHNGYISFWDSKKKTTGWFDNNYLINYACDYVKSDTNLNIEITPNNTIILRSRYETFVVCNGNCVYLGHLDKVDEYNFYGVDNDFEDKENNWCIVNTKNGLIPVHGKSGKVYLIK